jgi:hypothetical protein
MRWVWLVASTEINSKLLHRTEGNRPLRRPRCRRYDINEKEVNAIGREDEDCNNVAQATGNVGLL